MFNVSNTAPWALHGVVWLLGALKPRVLCCFQTQPPKHVPGNVHHPGGLGVGQLPGLPLQCHWFFQVFCLNTDVTTIEGNSPEQTWAKTCSEASWKVKFLVRNNILIPVKKGKKNTFCNRKMVSFTQMKSRVFLRDIRGDRSWPLYLGSTDLPCN